VEAKASGLRGQGQGHDFLSSSCPGPHVGPIRGVNLSSFVHVILSTEHMAIANAIDRLLAAAAATTQDMHYLCF